MKELDPRELRSRTRRSFAIFFWVLVLAVGLWVLASRHGRTEDDPVSTVFHRVLEWNGKLWQSLYSPDRVVVTSPPQAGKRPRFNGSLGLETPIDLARWSMTVDSGVQSEKYRQLGIAELRALPRVETATEFKCIEGWSDNISYAGVRFSDFLKAYRIGTHSGRDWDPAHPPADTYRYVGLETPDGEYYVSIDMESMLHPQTVLAYEMNGKPLDLPNGAPLRLIIPVKYGIKSLKRIGKIFFSDQRPPDYWAEQGYDWFAGL